MENFVIDSMTKVIGLRNDGALLLTNSNATLKDIKENAAVFSKNLEQLTDVLPIGVLTKFDNWIETNYYFEKNEDLNIIYSSLLGFAIGEAFGFPYSNLSKKQINKSELNEMIDSNNGKINKGCFSDATSLVLATMDSIIECEGDIDYNHIMDNFLSWLMESRYSSCNLALGLTNSFSQVLVNYVKNVDASLSGCDDFNNISLIRILPISLYCILNNFNNDETINLINSACNITNKQDLCKLGCYIYTELLKDIIKYKNIDHALTYISNLDYSSYEKESIKKYDNIINNKVKEISFDEIKNSDGIIDTLQSVIYCLINSKNYKDSIILSTSLGGDNDARCALTGAISSLIYGIKDIPIHWIRDLKEKSYIDNIATDFDYVIRYKKCKLNNENRSK